MQDLDLSLYLLLLDWFEDFDDTFLIVGDIDTLEYLRILASTYSYHNTLESGLLRGKDGAKRTDLPDYLVVLQHPPGDIYTVIVPV